MINDLILINDSNQTVRSITSQMQQSRNISDNHGSWKWEGSEDASKAKMRAERASELPLHFNFLKYSKAGNFKGNHEMGSQGSKANI